MLNHARKLCEFLDGLMPEFLSRKARLEQVSREKMISKRGVQTWLAKIWSPAPRGAFPRA
jgi:hypothetical protein